MSSDRLTRRELSWLLTQEARGAADRLRQGVQILTQPPEPPAPKSDRAPASERPLTLSLAGEGAEGLESTLNALDEAMQRLSELSGPASGARSRRGRIDLGALLWELAPGARVSLEPGAGTEVFGEEAELRRMLNVLLGGTAGGATPQGVAVRREGKDVRLAVELGPDTAPISPAERAWLSRMSIRYGGRYELDGNSECLVFPALEAEDANEVLTLRRELEAAKAQGEAYARELAAVFEEPSLASRPPLVGETPYEGLAIAARLAEALADDLRAVFGPLGAARLRVGNGDALVEEVQRALARGADLLAVSRQMAKVGSGVGPIEVDLALLAQDEAALAAVAFASRSVLLTVAPAEAAEPLLVPGMPAALRALVAEMLDRALRSSAPRVEVRLLVRGPALVVEVSGPGTSLVDAGRTAHAFLQEIARAHGLRLEVEERRISVVVPSTPGAAQG
ncbi:MAG: HAMP domain-containing histidine kinase [Myxococcales bacterium]|nr:HAMP domain-containing histidine kinase [Myxococcales bacterium]